MHYEEVIRGFGCYFSILNVSCVFLKAETRKMATRFWHSIKYNKNGCKSDFIGFQAVFGNTFLFSVIV